MTLDEALSAAILGDRVRAVDMPEGVYVDYHFQGWRKNFPTGSSSGFIPMAHDATVAWEVVALPEPKSVVSGKWGTGAVPNSVETVLVQTESGWGEAKPAVAGGWGNVRTGESGVVRNEPKPATDKWGRPL